MSGIFHCSQKWTRHLACYNCRVTPNIQQCRKLKSVRCCLQAVASPRHRALGLWLIPYVENDDNALFKALCPCSQENTNRNASFSPHKSVSLDCRSEHHPKSCPMSMVTFHSVTLVSVAVSDIQEYSWNTLKEGFQFIHFWNCKVRHLNAWSSYAYNSHQPQVTTLLVYQWFFANLNRDGVYMGVIQTPCFLSQTTPVAKMMAHTFHLCPCTCPLSTLDE